LIVIILEGAKAMTKENWQPEWTCSDDCTKHDHNKLPWNPDLHKALKKSSAKKEPQIAEGDDAYITALEDENAELRSQLTASMLHLKNFVKHAVDMAVAEPVTMDSAHGTGTPLFILRLEIEGDDPLDIECQSIEALLNDRGICGLFHEGFVNKCEIYANNKRIAGLPVMEWSRLCDVVVENSAAIFKGAKIVSIDAAQ